MSASRFTFLALAVGLMAAPAASAQTKTTTTKKTTTTTKKPAAKTTAKPAVTKTTSTKVAATTKAPTAPAPAPLTAEEATAGVREALSVSITRGLEAGGQADGFNTNPDVRLGFPPEAELVATTLRGLRMGAVIDKFEVLLNRSAESVAANPQTAAIFNNALQRLAIADALALVNSREGRAAAQLLKQQTAAQVQEELKPLVAAALEQTGAKQLYGELMLRYKKVPLVTPISTDLTTYATGGITEGIYTLIADEESRIRLNASARTTASLQRVFGSR
ncbi:DUF4197 domain-containing protein [Hymenobacter latericus]|uniref:DUF4197 domain-containing protein n=1 Tax=Hymenobacter sp. YIM 151858-1 TaxID=2987688 RepID=UPI0022274ED8|nr:DUF4197 domain-containing protein [Hymenobacter sp. YIM 151858-1]UYZ60420.1 DUF4197 domain-containing protein [Hymenobacter sp. YIM 151858-1]